MPPDRKKEPRTLAPMPPIRKPAVAVKSVPTLPTTTKSPLRDIPVRNVRFMLADEKDTILSWRKMDKEVAEFCFCWERWKKWDAEPPIVVSVEGMLVGYHGVSFGKPRGKSLAYVNSTSQFVLPEWRGKQLAGSMINCLLGEAYERSIPRLRFRTPIGGPGYDTWRGFGVFPFATGKGNQWFDLDIRRVPDIGALLRLGGGLHLSPTTCPTRLGYYRRTGLTPTEWGEAYSPLLLAQLG